MAYSSGSTIQMIDYNYLTWGGNTTNTYSGTINNIAMVCGTGYGYKGYGQTVSPISATTQGTTVTATQWAGLVYTLNKMLAHQSGSGAQLASGSNIGITAGATIAAFANVSAGVTTINTNANVYAAQGTTTTGSGYTANPNGGSGTISGSWTRTVTFASADQARYFFNAGGQINWVITGATNNNGTLRSGDLVTQFGTNQAGGSVKNASAIPRTGSGGTVDVANTGLGYWALTSSAQVCSKITSANYRYEYNQDYTAISLRTNGVQGANGDVGSVLYIDFNWYMYSTYAGVDDDVNVTVSYRIDIVYPETTYLSNSWGTVTVS